MMLLLLLLSSARPRIASHSQETATHPAYL
jgi:hypothetical protein